MRYRVLLAGLFHETHTFLAGTTAPQDFQRRVGAELLEAKGDGSPLAGVLDVAAQHDWDLTPIIDLRATPGPTVDDAVFADFWEHVEQVARPRLATGSVDGLFLVLHGAMVTPSFDDVEGEIVQRLRALPGGHDVRLCGVLDLHGNISPQTIEASDGFVAYRENPHTDACDAARRAAQWLQRLMTDGRRPVSLWSQPPVIWAPTGTATADEPMRSLALIARAAEAADQDIAAVNVFAGFSFADTRHTGVSFSVTTLGDRDAAQAVLDRLSQQAIEHQHLGHRVPPSLDEAWSTINEFLQADRTPVIVVEPADNIGGGAPGDTTDLLKMLIVRQVDRSIVAINDPQSVSHLAKRQVGERCWLSLGGHDSELFCQPLTVEVELVLQSDGRFDLEDPHSHLASMCGLHVNMGSSAVVRIRRFQSDRGELEVTADIRVLLTTYKTPPFDLGQWRSQGIEPTACRVIGVKAAVAHRRAYDPITGATITVDTSGPCSSDLARFPFRQVRRPVFPLDETLK